MKVKQQADDFQVEELVDFNLTPTGNHSFYRLEKRGWSTPDALALVCRRWRIPSSRLSFGGLKDRHAHTVQYLTIFHGPRRALEQQGIKVTYLGQVDFPHESSQIRANRFRITLRSLTMEQTVLALAALEEIRRDGVPNYFDDQRFGSVSRTGEFLGKKIVLGQFEEALRQALCEPYEFDRAAERREKTLIGSHWGDWGGLERRLTPGPTRQLIRYLVTHPHDFRGAIARLQPQLRSLFLSAYQSDLWNRMLARWIHLHVRSEQVVVGQMKRGQLPFWQQLEPEQRQQVEALSLPLPSARLRLSDSDPHAELVHAVMAEEGLELRQMQVKGIRELFFSKGDRAGLCLPQGLTGEPGDDELQEGYRKLVLSFELARGSYATLIVKRLDCVRTPHDSSPREASLP